MQKALLERISGRKSTLHFPKVNPRHVLHTQSHAPPRGSADSVLHLMHSPAPSHAGWGLAALTRAEQVLEGRKQTSVQHLAAKQQAGNTSRELQQIAYTYRVHMLLRMWPWQRLHSDMVPQP